MRQVALTFAWIGLIPAAQAQPEIRTDDVALFYRVYDAAGGAPSASARQRDYLDAASDGVRQFIPHRIVSAEALATAIENKRPVYEKARQCVATLPRVRDRIAAALARLAQLLPNVKQPPVTILVGGANSGGTTGAAGVLIGIETICSADWLQTNLEDRLVYLIAHEYVHVQQPVADPDANPLDGKHTVLQVALVEGIADFIAELAAGSASNTHLQAWTQGRETEMARDFLRDATGTNVLKWAYGGVGTREQPGDLGYWVGYRIAKCYYTFAKNKQAAVQELVRLENPTAILQHSGWPDGKDGVECFP